MAMLHICSCSNPDCDCVYTFTSNGTGFMRSSYWQHHRQITDDIAAGKYGEELRRSVVDPESIYLDREADYYYCPVCDWLGLGGRIAVWQHKEGKPAQLEYDDWNESYYLAGFCAEENYRKILRIPTPCGRCGGEEQYYDSFEDMTCPKCGSRMKDGELDRYNNRTSPIEDCESEEEEAATERKPKKDSFLKRIFRKRSGRSKAPGDEGLASGIELPEKKAGGLWDGVRRQAAQDPGDDDEEPRWLGLSADASSYELSEEEKQHSDWEDGEEEPARDPWAWDAVSFFQDDEDLDDQAMPELTRESLAAYHNVAPECIRIGQTPDGGVYSIVTEIGNRVFISEFDENHEEIMHTSGYFVNVEELDDGDEVDEDLLAML